MRTFLWTTLYLSHYLFVVSMDTDGASGKPSVSLLSRNNVLNRLVELEKIKIGCHVENSIDISTHVTKKMK